MIAFLKGKVINKGLNFIILLVNDIGYKVFVNQNLFAQLSIGQSLELYIYQHVREDILALYGFNSMDDLEMFELLLGVSGIGPKSALGVSTIASASELRETIAKGDSSLLTKVSGIGKKTAERVVLELRTKVGAVKSDSFGKGSMSAGGDEIDALMALGYSLSQARDALRKVDPSIKDSGERIKAALKSL